jgi:choline dehydrogenase
VDRGSTPYSFQYSQSAHDSAYNEYIATRTGPLTAIPSNALAFPSLPQTINNTPDLVGAASAGGRYYPDGYESTLKAGYEKQLSSILTRLLENTTPAYENLNNNAGGLDLSLQHPLSRGTVRISSSDPFTAPSIDPRWLINPFDRQVMIAAMEFNQKILDTAPIQQLLPSYGSIPQDATADDLNTILQDSIGTEYHYSGTCAMLPLDLGGVVDANLLIYGTDNVRVVDTSIFPLVPTAHLSAVVYAIAEKVSFLYHTDSTDADNT